MSDKFFSLRDDQLRRKLELLLGSKHDWLEDYATWCADNDVGSDTELHEDHNIQLFVRLQRGIK